MALATIAEVIRRMEDEPDEDLHPMIEDALEEASDLAHFYGNPGWTEENVPGPVRRIVVAATARYANNPSGFNTSRAADETVGWSDDLATNVVEFTENEIDRVRRFGQTHTASFGSMGAYAWDNGSSTPEVVYAPWGLDPRNKPFPLIQINDAQGVYRWRG